MCEPCYENHFLDYPEPESPMWGPPGQVLQFVDFWNAPDPALGMWALVTSAIHYAVPDGERGEELTELWASLLSPKISRLPRLRRDSADQLTLPSLADPSPIWEMGRYVIAIKSRIQHDISPRLPVPSAVEWHFFWATLHGRHN